MNITNYLEAIGFALTDFELKNSKLKLDSLKVFSDLFKGFLRELTNNEKRKNGALILNIKIRQRVIAERLQKESYDFDETLDIYEAIINNLGRDV